VLTAGLSVATEIPAAAYSPGTAIAYKPTYNVNEGGYNYHCSFAGWRSGAKVTWHCDLIERFMNEGGWPDERTIGPHSGSWTPAPSGKSTSTWLRKAVVGQGELCVVAHALSVDGGSTSQRCQG